MDNIELSNGTFIKCKSLSNIEFNKLRNGAVGPIAKFKMQFGVEVYQLNKSEVIAGDEGYYMLFDNVGDVEKVLADHKSSNGTEILSYKNPFGKDFPRQTDLLIRELADTLSVNYIEVDEKLLRDLDDKLKKVPNSSEFNKRHMINFIAVVGEVLIKKKKTQWEMILSSDGKTWNPYLNMHNRPVEFFTYVYEDIYSKGNSMPFLSEIYETMNIILNSPE
ncbi:hypothetical protein FFJ24_010405 [Pedobacter sp. KBS0701]|uniref:hypothetical protein n=1 Tax=Pedobacter sp. KBS0701 TaxID=2578106 RepID=UPI00110F1356|nr:hypothetical protein [Pedobacter sp. KBS0701]QDW25199.1 hypothetical protein FFJ24_010405 [Pedobacter sp. KBS0701]